MWQLSQFEQWQAVGDLQRQRTMFHLNEERHFQDEMETLLSVGQGNIESPDRREGSCMFSPGTTVQKFLLKVVLVWPFVKPKWSTSAARRPPPDVIDGSSSYPKSWVQALVLFLPCPHASEIPVVLRTFK